MTLKVSLDSPVAASSPQAKHESFINLKAKLSASLTAPQNAKWSWDATPISPEHKAQMVDFFRQNAPAKPAAPVDTDFFA